MRDRRPEHEVEDGARAEGEEVRRLDRQIGRLEVELPGHDVGHVRRGRDKQQAEGHHPRSPRHEDQGQDEDAAAEHENPDRRAARPVEREGQARRLDGDDLAFPTDVEPNHVVEVRGGVGRRRPRRPREPERVRRPCLDGHPFLPAPPPPLRRNSFFPPAAPRPRRAARPTTRFEVSPSPAPRAPPGHPSSGGPPARPGAAPAPPAGGGGGRLSEPAAGCRKQRLGRPDPGEPTDAPPPPPPQRPPLWFRYT